MSVGTSTTNRLVFFGVLTALAAAPARALHPAAPTGHDEPRPLAPVILDAGHGGDDLGAVVNGLKEKDIALAFARKLRARLHAASVPVTLTRDEDAFVPLDRRVVDSVDWSGSAFVSLHLNEVKSRRMSGVVIYSYGPERLKKWRKKRHPSVPPMPAPPRSQAAESAALSRALGRALRDGGFRVENDKSDYYVLKNPAQPSVLVELGYLSNPEEAAKLVDPAYQDRMVEVIARALETWSSERVLRTALTGL
jgi:N-acetylmuramoyl-L-alanine amidase